MKLKAYWGTVAKWEVLLTLIAAFVIGMAAVYLTPLKYSQLIEPTIHDVDAREIYEDMKTNPEKYDFIDVRGAADYDNLHAAGSRHIPLYRMYFERETLPKSGKTLVFICSGGVASGVAYMYLEHYGFKNMVRVDGGIENWQGFGLPTASTAR